MRTLTTAQAKAMAALNRGPRAKRARPKPQLQAIAMQASLLASATDPEVPPHIRAACARAWEVLEERLRILSNTPLPGQLRPDLEQRRTSRSRKPKAMLSISPSDLPSSGEPSSGGS